MKTFSLLNAASVFLCSLILGGVVLFFQVIRDEETTQVLESDLGNNIFLRVKADPGERSWAFLYEVRQGDAEIVPWTFFGTGGLAHVNGHRFRTKRIPNSQVLGLFENDDPTCFFLLLDLRTLRYCTVANNIQNDFGLLEAINPPNGLVKYRLDSFQGRR